MATGENKVVTLRSPRGVLVRVSEKTAANLGSTYKPAEGWGDGIREGGDASEEVKSYEDMTNAALKDLLGERGLSKQGNHDALVARLLEADAADAEDAEVEDDEVEDDEDESEDESDNSDNA